MTLTCFPLPPFGMVMPERKYVAQSSYRYGFNGKENDNEVKGEDSQQDYGMRIYDPRVGRFLSVDPLSKSYPWYTPYQFAGNKPIWAIDLDGAEELTLQEMTKRTASLQIEKVIVIDNRVPYDISRARSASFGNIFSERFNLYLNKFPTNGGGGVSEITKDQFDAGEGVMLEVQFNVTSQALDHGDFIVFKAINRFNPKFSFLNAPPSSITFSSSDAAFQSTTYLPHDIWYNRDFFESSGLSSATPSLEELISHEVGKHNMMGESEIFDPALGHGRYPDPGTITLGSNTKGEIKPSKSDVLSIINQTLRSGRIGTDLQESLNSLKTNKIPVISIKPDVAQRPELQTKN